MRFRQQVKSRRGRAGQVAKRPVRARGPLLCDLVDIPGEPREYPGGPHRVKREQSHGRAHWPGHRLVGRDPRGIPWVAPGGRGGCPEDDGVMRSAPVRCAAPRRLLADSTSHARPPAREPLWSRPQRQGSPAPLRSATRPAPRAAAHAPAAARPPAARGPGSARPLRHQAQTRIHHPERGRLTLPAPRSSVLPRRRRRPGPPRPVPPSAAARGGTAQGSAGRPPCRPSRRAQRLPSARAPRRETASPRAAAPPRSPPPPAEPAGHFTICRPYGARCLAPAGGAPGPRA